RDIQGKIRRESMLEIKVPFTDVGRPQVTIDAHDRAGLRLKTAGQSHSAIAASGRSRIDRRVRAIIRPVVFDRFRLRLRSKRSARKRDRANIDGSARRRRRRVSIRVKRYAGGQSSQSQQVAQSHERIEAALLKIDSGSCTDYSPAGAGDIV